ncbi:13941_t:CDS:2 [Funneliformis caledonium]|uniref:13941_t:CDS:1 n=1 Tax=Funneliformis caledonium TaxID=1117310 RepID=A0A9N9BWD3_9GLOM|nr:13941_t:CDS:2 [Funneliformis caledonium]
MNINYYREAHLIKKRILMSEVISKIPDKLELPEEEELEDELVSDSLYTKIDKNFDDMCGKFMGDLLFRFPYMVTISTNIARLMNKK